MRRRAPCGFELPPQIADLDVDDIRLRHEVEIPDILEQHRPGHHLPRPAHGIIPSRVNSRGNRSTALPSRVHLLFNEIHLQGGRPAVA